MTTVAVHVHSDASSARGGETVLEMVAEEAFRHYARVWKSGTLAVNRSYLANQILPWFRGRPIAECHVRRRAALVRFPPREAGRGRPVAADTLGDPAPRRDPRVSDGGWQSVPGHPAVPAAGPRTIPDPGRIPSTRHDVGRTGGRRASAGGGRPSAAVDGLPPGRGPDASLDGLPRRPALRARQRPGDRSGSRTRRGRAGVRTRRADLVQSCRLVFEPPRGPPEAEAPAHSTPDCEGATPRGCITQR